MGIIREQRHLVSSKWQPAKGVIFYFKLLPEIKKGATKVTQLRRKEGDIFINKGCKRSLSERACNLESENQGLLAFLPRVLIQGDPGRICCEFNLMLVSFYSRMARDELCCSTLPRLIRAQWKVSKHSVDSKSTILKSIIFMNANKPSEMQLDHF